MGLIAVLELLWERDTGDVVGCLTGCFVEEVATVVDGDEAGIEVICVDCGDRCCD